MSAPLTKPQPVNLPSKHELANLGVSCERLVSHFLLKIPRAVQWQLVGDKRRATAYDVERVHRHIFQQFHFAFDNEWTMDRQGDYALFYQHFDSVSEEMFTFPQT